VKRTGRLAAAWAVISCLAYFAGCQIHLHYHAAPPSEKTALDKALDENLAELLGGPEAEEP
jgi:hypothetical protein